MEIKPRRRRSVTCFYCFTLVLICISTYYMYGLRNWSRLELLKDASLDNTNEISHSFVDGRRDEELTEVYRDSMNPDERAAFAREMCKSANITHPREFNSDTQHRLLIHRPTNMMMCYVAKAGCTYWKRVFIALMTGSKESGDKELNALELPTNMVVHGYPIPNLSSMKTPDEMFLHAAQSKKFIFVRNPYARLFSAYVDKFYIYETYRLAMMILYGVKDYTGNCLHDLTFTDFLRRVVKDNVHWIIRASPHEHWVPITDICRPCMVDYDFIGNVETFEKDREYIMGKIGLDSIMNSQNSFEETARDTISRSRFYNPQVEGKCMTKTVYINRLYDTYRLQGYMAPGGFIHAHDGMTQEEFIAILLSQFEGRNLTHAQWKKQRHEAFMDAYKHVPIDVKLGIVDNFKLDFQIFGYDPKPKEIFPD